MTKYHIITHCLHCSSISVTVTVSRSDPEHVVTMTTLVSMACLKSPGRRRRAHEEGKSHHEGGGADLAETSLTLCFFFLKRVSLCSSGWLQPGHSPVSVSYMSGLYTPVIWSQPFLEKAPTATTGRTLHTLWKPTADLWGNTHRRAISTNH